MESKHSTNLFGLVVGCLPSRHWGRKTLSHAMAADKLNAERAHVSYVAPESNAATREVPIRRLLELSHAVKLGAGAGALTPFSLRLAHGILCVSSVRHQT